MLQLLYSTGNSMTLDIKKRVSQEKDEEIESFFQDPSSQYEEELLESPDNPLLEEHSRDVLLHWRAPEYEIHQWNRKWYLAATLILAAIIVYALISNSPIMAITFILVGIVGYLYLQKDPRVLDFMITPEGIIVGDEIYEFENIQSFWIFYKPYVMKVISLRVKGKLVPHVHIPVHDQDPVKIREILLEFIPEKKQELTLVDTIEKVLRL
ncbi:MAG: hypothetical protein NT136_02085 [Candidatus Moranbacteria bacterium]|nr:hypothetical protein [Candidatus Moranbacteria bacterium]